jgi:hypothetical protein
VEVTGEMNDDDPRQLALETEFDRAWWEMHDAMDAAGEFDGRDGA